MISHVDNPYEGGKIDERHRVVVESSGIVSPWTVDSVTMDVEKQRVDVTVSHPPRILFSCPECGTESPVFDHAGERVCRHLDSCQFFTYFHRTFVTSRNFSKAFLSPCNIGMIFCTLSLKP